MSAGPSSLKRKRPGIESLSKDECEVYNVIRSKESMGMFQADMRFEIKLLPAAMTKAVKSLLNKNMIKEVKSIMSPRGKKHYMAADFEPSIEHTGGAWYADGKLDTEFINLLKKMCEKIVSKQQVCTLEGISDSLKRTNVTTVELSKQQIEEIMKALVLDGVVMEVKSTGTGDFSTITAGKVCYKSVVKRTVNGEAKLGAFASIPCGRCPNISMCTPDGIISPATCVYYSRWLEY